ncbi:MAG: hypothetical protein U9R68_03430 [Planctomycetota bacterium]|nr:hypothetical protein [Planctomycetota bacterium]
MDLCERFAQLSVPERGLPAASHTLAVARNVLSGEVKYFMLNVPDSLPFTLELICTIAGSGGLGLALQSLPWYGKVAERP